MKHLDERLIQDVMARARIEDVAQDILGSYSRSNPTGLKRNGVRYTALCPFHDDKHIGSFVVYPKGNCYKCFACGASGGVVDFVMKTQNLRYRDAMCWLGKKYNIDMEENDYNYIPAPPRPKPQPLPTLTLPMGMVTAREIAKITGAGDEGPTTGDNLVDWILNGVKWDSVQRSRIPQVLRDYHVGHAKGGHTIFWQIDERGKVRTGKMMKYRTDGHRDKEARWNFDYIHSTLIRRHDAMGNITDEGPWPFSNLYNPDKQEARLTYFGMHLIGKYRKKGVQQTISIVESEKTALLMAIAYGNTPCNLWIACGGMTLLNRERMEPLIADRRKIVLYPDRDGVERWRQQAERLHYDNISINTDPVTKWWQPEDGEKADIADVVIRAINSHRPMTTLDEVRREMPKAIELINNLDLTIENE